LSGASLSSGIRVVALTLAVLAVTASAAGASTPRKKKVVPPLVSNTAHVVVPRGQPIQIAFASDSGFDGTASLTDAIRMAVANHPAVLGFPIRINTVNAPTCGSPPNTVSAAMTAAYKITANLQNVAVLGQVCSHGFAQALAIYQKSDLVVISGSATNAALPAAGPTVFNRTIVDDNRVDDWYPVISQLPSELAWRLDYTDKFGSPPSNFADLYYDAANIVIDDVAGASKVDAKGELVVNRAALATAVRTTSAYPGVTCSVTIDSIGDRTDDSAAINTCAG
jgi:hypothetical protein